MKIRSMQTCIMSSLPRCIFRCSVFRYVTLVSFSFLFFFQTLLFNCNSFTLVANKYLLTYLLSPCFILGRENVPCVAEVVNRSLKADCTDFTNKGKARVMLHIGAGHSNNC